MQLVVAEQVVDAGLDGGECCGFRHADDAQNILGDGVLEPVDEALVNHHPLGVAAASGGRGSSNVGAEAKFSDDGVHEAAPLGVIRLGDVEDNGNVRLDVHGLESHRRSRQSRGRCIRAASGVSNRGCRGGGGVASAGEVEQRVERRAHGGEEEEAAEEEVVEIRSRSIRSHKLIP
jgi:hypothetical protein